jgi:hypothetical protein
MHVLIWKNARGDIRVYAQIKALARALGKRKRRESTIEMEETNESPLWEAIVSNDDVCFKHILPKLNGTDIKFLHDVNGETRALIKRSSREGELKKSFRVAEMSSISTLEVAWKNRKKKSLWPIWWWSESNFCQEVAETNKLELLEWIREEKKCEWGTRMIDEPAKQGNLEIVKYCIANEYPVDEWACALAARNGRLECLKYLHEEAKAPWDWRTALYAAENGHLHILEYLVERKYEHIHAGACRCAVRNGHLDCLKFLHETAKAPWDLCAVSEAYVQDEPECLQYLLDNDCPLPHWHGELHAPHVPSP